MPTSRARFIGDRVWVRTCVIPSAARSAKARNRDHPGRGLAPRSGRLRFLAFARNDTQGFYGFGLGGAGGPPRPSGAIGAGGGPPRPSDAMGAGGGPSRPSDAIGAGGGPSRPSEAIGAGGGP